MHAIEVISLSKSYGGIMAVDGIDLRVEKGKIFGFLGPNGAGKTTTMKMLTTLIPPSSGTMTILGIDGTKSPLEIRKKIGVVLQQPSYEPTLSVEKSLEKYGMMWNVDRKIRKNRVEELLVAFDLVDIRKKKNDDLSIGQRRRVQVAREFMHDMDLLFLDEPTVGLDPSARRTLLDYIKNQVKSGLTVFFTTHIMEEAEYLCDEIAIIDKGRIIAFDTPTGLKQKYGVTKNIELRVKDLLAKSVIDLIATVIDKSHIETTGTDTLIIRVDNAQEIIIRIIQLFSKNDIQIESIAINPPSLEEVFLTIVNDRN